VAVVSSAFVRHRRNAEIADIRLFPVSPHHSPIQRTALLRVADMVHPAQSAMLEHELDKPAPPPVAEGIAAGAKNGNLGQLQTFVRSKEDEAPGSAEAKIRNGQAERIVQADAMQSAYADCRMRLKSLHLQAPTSQPQ
jgi:hypothetical protein